MKDEIKEILNYLTKFINDKEEITKYGCEISAKQAKQLLDLITNLQEELKETADLCSKHFVKIQTLKEENERLRNKLQQKENIIKEVREYNEQIIKDTKDFYRPTEDIIYSGDCLIDIATQNLEILDKENNNETI